MTKVYTSVFDHIFKYRESVLGYTRGQAGEFLTHLHQHPPSVVNSNKHVYPLGTYLFLKSFGAVWICGETLELVLDVDYQTNMFIRRN